MIIFGTRGRESAGEEILAKACPGCKSDLQHTHLIQWFTLYFIPVFPFNTVDSFFKCISCGQSYKESIKDHIMSPKDREKFEDDSKKSFVTTLAACMYYMAGVDGKVDKSEIAEIKKVTDKFPQFSKQVNSVKNKSKQEVMEMVSQTRNHLTVDGISLMVGQIARVLLADGRIDKKEEKLMKEFLTVAGVPTSLYKEIIEKVKNV